MVYIPIENCDFMPIITDYNKIKKYFLCNCKLVVFLMKCLILETVLSIIVLLILKTLKYSHFIQTEMDISSVNSL